MPGQGAGEPEGLHSPQRTDATRRMVRILSRVEVIVLELLMIAADEPSAVVDWPV